MSDTPALANQALESLSAASQDDLIRNLLHRIDAANNREHGLLEIANAIAQNTSAPGVLPDTAYGTVAAASALRPLIVCPGSSRIILYSVVASVSGAAVVTLTNQRGVAAVPAIRFAAAGSVCWQFERGFMLPTDTSLTWANSAAVTAEILVSYSIL